MKNLREEIQRMKQMMGIITESNVNRTTLINESVEGKRCWYYKKIADGSYANDKRVPNPYNGVGDVQEFLIKIGYKIKKDWDFGNNTAKALATWSYGANQGIDSVNKLWTRMKKDGWDVGETSGYGPKMMKSVGGMIVKICKSLSKTCKVDQQTLFDMEFDLVPKEVSDAKNITLPAELNKSFKYAVDYWKKYLNAPAVREKIYNNMTTTDYLKDMFSLDGIVQKYLNVLDKVEKKGWVDYTKRANEVGASMYVNGDCPKYSVCVNMDTYYTYLTKGLDFLREKSKNTFVHEIQHILWEEVQKLNSTVTIKQAFPAAYDYYGTDKKEITNASKIDPIPAESKKELDDRGLNYKDLVKYYSNEEWKSGYNCDWNEKLSNLASYRSYLTQKGLIKMGGDIPLNIIIKHIKSTIDGSPISGDFERMIGCWVIGNFKPKLSVFVKELNELAKNDIDSKEKDFKNPNQIEKPLET